MAENRHIQNSSTTRRNIRVADKVVTTDATPATAYSIPLGENRVTSLTVTITAVNSTFTASQRTTSSTSFYRATGGNVTRAAAVLTQSSGNFAGAQPLLDIAANTGTQSIDVKVTGKAATTISWYILIESLQNLD